MAREHENFRPMLEQLNRAFPEKEFLKRQDLAQFLDCSERTIDRKFADLKTDFGFSKVIIAKKLCTLTKGVSA